MASEPTVRSCGLIVVRAGDSPSALCIRRQRSWELPKGRVEPTDPDMVQCAIRELREEAGLLNAIEPAKVEVVDRVRYEMQYKGKRELKEVTYFGYLLPHDEAPQFGA
eukprot:TRINITY_DN1742_c1_g1_i1.p1 TRINITY_DN1742_c1_g1~~TRINITY_DN1742_c1_g1_i1.p1  ORF type:complete len:108 (-),score=15.51 TRINITY_DN1742_c1_g1_i1:158-481(-)